MFDVIVTATALPSDVKPAVVAETVRMVSPAAWVTVTVWLPAPVALTVMTAVRVPMVGFTVAVKVRSAVSVPVVLSRVSQLWSDTAVQGLLDNTVTLLLLPAVFARVAVVAETPKVAAPAACVTVIVLAAVTPIAERVTVAVRAVMVLFSEAVRTKVPLPMVADVGLTVNQL